MAISKFTKTKAELSQLPPGKKERASALLSKVMFMEKQLEDLQEIIKKKGWTEEYQNGANQKGIKKSTEGETYQVMIKNYAAAIDRLDKMLPDGLKETDELMDFISTPR